MVYGEDGKRAVADRPLNDAGLPNLDLLVVAEPSALPVVRARLTTWLSELHWPTGHITGSVTAVNEAVSNSVEHAYGQTADEDVCATLPIIGVVAVAATLRSGVDMVQFVVRDWGRWRPSFAPANCRYGMGLMGAFMQDVIVDTTADGTTVTLITPPVTVLNNH